MAVNNLIPSKGASRNLVPSTYSTEPAVGLHVFGIPSGVDAFEDSWKYHLKLRCTCKCTM